MTQAQLKSKLKELIKSDKAFINGLVDKVIKSGCLNVAEAENNYALPKNVLSAVYREMSRQYAPLNKDPKSKKRIDDIYNRL